MISEPSTMISDYILGVACTFLGISLFKKGRTAGAKSIMFWSISFFATGLAAYLGGTWHGFYEVLGTSASDIIWKGTVFCIGLMSLTMLAGSVKAVIPFRHHRWILLLLILKYMLFAIWMLTHDDFVYVIYDYAPAMFAVLILHTFDFFKKGNKGSIWIVIGIISSLLGALLQQLQFSLHTHFNHNDIYHTIQLISMFIFFRGVKTLQDRY